MVARRQLPQAAVYRHIVARAVGHIRQRTAVGIPRWWGTGIGPVLQVARRYRTTEPCEAMGSRATGVQQAPRDRGPVSTGE